MSHRVTVSLDIAAAEWQVVCDRAADSLHRLDDVIADIRDNATRFSNTEVQGYIAVLEASKSEIQRSLRDFENYLGDAKKRSGTFQERDRIMERARELSRKVRELTGPRLDILPEMISEQLFANMERYQEELRHEEQRGRFSMSDTDFRRLSEILDVGLRECVYRELLSGRYGSFATALDSARKKYREKSDRLLEKNREKVLGRMKTELAGLGLDTSRIDSMLNNTTPLTEKSVMEICGSADESIRNEMLRQKEIGMIVAAIRKQGFDFDPKQCLRIDRETNVASIAVKSADGRQVTFEVYLDGRFMYHFEGYEGMACTRDENPFLETLEKVYGMKISGVRVDWENPDRLQNRTNVAGKQHKEDAEKSGVPEEPHN